MYLNTFIFVRKHISDYAKANRSVLLLNMSCRNSSQYNGSDIRGYPNLATIVARGSERVKYSRIFMKFQAQSFA